MIFSEKITELRKRSGLSQEQFGDKIGVSRQAVSKWEMAQSVPDINKVMLMADFFGVSVDTLLNDSLELEDVKVVPSDSVSRKLITLEDANSFFLCRKRTARLVVLAILLFFVSPVLGMILSVVFGSKIALVGVIVQVICFVCAAVCIVLAVWGESRFKYFSEPGREVDYGVKGLAEKCISLFDRTRLIGIVLGIVLLVMSVVPMVVCAVFTDTNDLVIVLMGALMLLMVAFGVSCIVYVSLIYRGYVRIRSHC